MKRSCCTDLLWQRCDSSVFNRVRQVTCGGANICFVCEDRRMKMQGDSYWSMAMIPILMLIVLAYYGARLLVLHDISAIRGKDQTKKLKDEERYATEAGKLMLFLAAGSLIMTVLLYFHVIAAVVQIVVWVVIFGILWKKMDERYGA